MSPRKTILKELRSAQENGDQDYLHPSQITGYNGNMGKYQTAVNGLLKERLINGKKGQDGSMAIALNAGRMGDVRKELRPWFISPVVWVMVSLVALGVFGIVG